jgi:nifR3 family TIM-barrel protein
MITLRPRKINFPGIAGRILIKKAGESIITSMFPVENRLFLAPMAGYSDPVFRMVCREFGCDVTLSEMVHCSQLVRRHRGSIALLARSAGDAPLGVQFYGSDPEAFRQAAEYVQATGAGEFIDINCGCPVRKIMRRGEGSALLKDPGRIGRIVASVKKGVSLPVSVKIRLGLSTEQRNYLEVCREAEQNGADMIVVHARDLKQLFAGPPDLEAVAEIKRAVRVPVVANGGVTDHRTFSAMKSTGCDAVMIGRAALSRPWVFAAIRAAESGRNFVFGLEEGLSLFRRHAGFLMERLGERQGLRAYLAFSMNYMKAVMEDSGAPLDKSYLRRYHGISDRAAFEGFTESLGEYCAKASGRAAAKADGQ